MASKLPEELISQAKQGVWTDVDVQLREWTRTRSKVDVLKEVLKVQDMGFTHWFLNSDFAPHILPTFYQGAVRRAMIHGAKDEMQTLLDAMERYGIRFSWNEIPMSSPVIYAIQHNHPEALEQFFPLCEVMGIPSVVKEQRHQYAPLFYAMQKMDKELIEKVVAFYDAQQVPLGLGDLVGVAKTQAFEFLISILPVERVEAEKMAIIEGILKKGRADQIDWMRGQFDTHFPEYRDILLSCLSRKSDKSVPKFVDMLYELNTSRDSFSEVVIALINREQTKTRAGLQRALEIYQQEQWPVQEEWVKRIITTSLGPEFTEDKRQFLLQHHPVLAEEVLGTVNYLRLLDSESTVYLKTWCEKQSEQPGGVFSLLTQKKINNPTFFSNALSVFEACGWSVLAEKTEHQREILPYLLQGIRYPQMVEWVDALARMGLDLNGSPGKSEWSQYSIYPGGLIHSIFRLQESYMHRYLKPFADTYVAILSRDDVQYPSVEAMEKISVRYPEFYELLTTCVHRRHMQAILPQTSSTPSKLRL